MNYSLRLRPELVDDVHEAFVWYEAAATGLGHDFVRSYFAATAAAHREPPRFRKVYRGFRRVLLKRFPYVLYFRVERQTVIIFMLAHGARNPAWIQASLDHRGKTPTEK